jgi:hypothetical protein
MVTYQNKQKHEQALDLPRAFSFSDLERQFMAGLLAGATLR